MTNYPDSQDNSITLPGVSGDGDGYIATNALRDAVFAIETELGITPSGIYSDVRVRFDVLESRIGNPLTMLDVENLAIIGNDGVSISSGDGYPITNELPGSLYLRRDGYSNEGLYTMRVDGYWQQISTTYSSFGDSIGATNADIVIIPIIDNTSVRLSADVVVSNDTDNGGGGFSTLTAHYERVNPGGPVLVGSAVGGVAQVGAAISTAAISFVVSGNNIILRGTGVTAKNIHWSADVAARTTRIS